VTELIDLLRNPEHAGQYVPEQWAAVLEQGQRQLMLGQVASVLQNQQNVGLFPAAVKRHFDLALLTAQRRVEVALWEVTLIRSIISEEIPVILLKGVAYAAAKDFHSVGRLFTDIDLLVPRVYLDEVESCLFSHGWLSGQVDEYDQKYYREWMHELPPMKHVRRQSVVDLHHAIVPVISRFSFHVDLLFQNAAELAPNLFVLSPVDRIIHCAIHALIEGESSKIFRELYDLFLLLEQHASSPDQLSHVFERAEQLGIEQLVGPPIQAARKVFGPGTACANGIIEKWLIDVAIGAGNNKSLRTRLARAGLLSYSHWIKMPIHRLIPHLLKKSIKEYFPARVV
jgi:hypothetical protein